MIKRSKHNYVGDYDQRLVMLTDNVRAHDERSPVMLGCSHVHCYEWLDVFNKDDDMLKAWIEMSMYDPIHY